MAYSINAGFPNGYLAGDIMSLRGTERRGKNFAKICVLGDIAVGKTSLAIRFIHNEFLPRYRPSFVMNHFEKVVQGPEGEFKVMVWDTAGSERFYSTTSHFVRGASGCLLVFDVTEKITYDNVMSYWGPQCDDWSPGIRKVMVANKIDLAEHKGWAVDMQEVKTFCNEMGIPLYEVSAKGGLNVEMCFRDSAGLVEDSRHYANPDDERYDAFMDSFSLVDNSSPAEEARRKKKRSCCPV